MKVGSMNGKSAGVQAFQMKMNPDTDAISKNLQNQIANAQKQMQELNEKKEISLEEKMKKRQEIQKQISDLQNQLRQHQIEQRKENQQKRDDDIPGDNRQAVRSKNGTTGMSSASMQAIISADSSMHQVKAQGAAKSQMEGRAGVLKAEIKLDGGRGGDVEKKKQKLAEAEAKAQDITASQMEVLSDMKKDLKEAAEAERDAGTTADKKDKAEDKDKTDKSEKKPGEVSEDENVGRNAPELAKYGPIDVVSEGIVVSIHTNGLAGNNVDVKL